MWDNFKAMPLLLKFLTAHAVACLSLLLGSVISHNSFGISGHSITYSEWWSSGTGIYVSTLGIFMFLGGVMMLRRAKHARLFYLSTFVLGYFANYFYFGGQLDSIIPALVITAFIGMYLYFRQPVRKYFATDVSELPPKTAATTLG